MGQVRRELALQLELLWYRLNNVCGVQRFASTVLFVRDDHPVATLLGGVSVVRAIILVIVNNHLTLPSRK